MGEYWQAGGIIREEGSTPEERRIREERTFRRVAEYLRSRSTDAALPKEEERSYYYKGALVKLTCWAGFCIEIEEYGKDALERVIEEIRREFPDMHFSDPQLIKETD